MLSFKIGNHLFISLCVLVILGLLVNVWLKGTEQSGVLIRMKFQDIQPVQVAHNFEQSNANQSYLILVWNNFGAINSAAFQNCSFSNCVTTKNQTRINESSAVVFHTWKHWEIPKHRSAHQFWIAALHETPMRKKSRLSPEKDGVFNATATYSHRSDILFDYGAFKPIDGRYFKINETKLKTKTKLVSWMVSHCRTDSRREEYVKEL